MLNLSVHHKKKKRFETISTFFSLARLTIVVIMKETMSAEILIIEVSNSTCFKLFVNHKTNK